MTAAGERLDASDAWLDLFGTDALWGRLPLDDARFASDYVVEAARRRAGYAARRGSVPCDALSSASTRSDRKSLSSD